jgi:hypothetical protein
MSIPILYIAAALAGVCRFTESPAPPAPMPGVLGGEPALRQLAATAHDRSATFRELILKLHARGGFVFLGWSPALPQTLGGALIDRIRITPDGTICLWVALRPARADESLIPRLAHELQHALEALNSGTPDGASLEPFFRRIAAFQHVVGYETADALAVQRRVQQELRGKPKAIPRK